MIKPITDYIVTTHADTNSIYKNTKQSLTFPVS